MTVDLAALKARLTDVPGIETLNISQIGGRLVAGFNGLLAAVDPSSNEDQFVAAIRSAAALRGVDPAPVSIETPMAPPASTQTSNPQGKPMSTPAPGSFAASIRAMMDDARAGVAQARADGLARVGEAVDRLNEAKVATTKVASQMASTIEDEAASVLSELGQISNDLG